jgi:hypothetical protein
MVQSLADKTLGAYKDISFLFSASPEKKEGLLAKLRGEVMFGVRGALRERYRAQVKMEAIVKLEKYFENVAGRAKPTTSPDENFEQLLERLREEYAEKLAEFKKGAIEDETLPPYFDAWCQATVDEIFRVLQQATESVN